MPPPHLSIRKVGHESHDVVRHLFEHYLGDMSEWFPIDTNPDGSYAYDTSSLWEQGYEVYLASVGDTPAGFALVGSAAEFLSGVQACDVHEFFVMREFRRHGVGQTMATLIWNEHPGPWLVRVLELNASAVLFWRTAISNYSRGSYHEEPRFINGRPWRFFRFG